MVCNFRFTKCEREVYVRSYSPSGFHIVFPLSLKFKQSRSLERSTMHRYGLSDMKKTKEEKSKSPKCSGQYFDL